MITLTDLLRADPGAELQQFRADVIRGLSRPQKELPAKYFYDAAGSELFEQITLLDEYYLTRTERAIMERSAGEMARLLGPGCTLVEFGSGNSAKTRVLLDHLEEPAAYIPVDVAAVQLAESAEALAREYPDLEILPLCADFTRPITLPIPSQFSQRRAIYFPGSTIGNFTPTEAAALMKSAARLCEGCGAMLLGVDLEKAPPIIEAAYNDARGISAAFNLNLLARINRELSGDFDLGRFAHRAFFNDREKRIEMHLLSLERQQVHIDDMTFVFRAGETIHTENSYKYSPARLAALAQASGFMVKRVWTDAQAMFAVAYLETV